LEKQADPLLTVVAALTLTNALASELDSEVNE
jgi:hypothetical protein